MPSLKYLQDNLPEQKWQASDYSRFASAKPGTENFVHAHNPPCYWKMFPQRAKDLLLVPYKGYRKSRASTAPPRLFRNMWNAYRDHGFFPKDSFLRKSSKAPGFEVFIPANTTTENTLKLAAFTYRYMECQHPKDMVLAYRQWLASKGRGITLWQCFHWMMSMRGYRSGHGIYHFNGPFRYDPLLALAFGIFCRTSLKDHKKDPTFTVHQLTSAIDNVMQNISVKKGESIQVPLKHLLSSKVGKLMADPLNVDLPAIHETIAALPKAKKVKTGQLRGYYY